MVLLTSSRMPLRLVQLTLQNKHMIVKYRSFVFPEKFRKFESSQNGCKRSKVIVFGTHSELEIALLASLIFVNLWNRSLLEDKVLGSTRIYKSNIQYTDVTWPWILLDTEAFTCHFVYRYRSHGSAVSLSYQKRARYAKVSGSAVVTYVKITINGGYPLSL